MESTKNATRLAQSASALGAGILGFGMGAKWGGRFFEYTIVIIVVGAILHIAGMYVMQLKKSPEESNRIAKLLWFSAWTCLIAIIILLFVL